jgi:hypothetical protein
VPKALAWFAVAVQIKMGGAPPPPIHGVERQSNQATKPAKHFYTNFTN